MKKLINRPEDVVKEALAGMQAAHSDLIRVDIEQRIIVRKDAPVQGKVGVISGGRSGHEPMHGGFVGYLFFLHFRPATGRNQTTTPASGL